MRRHRKIRSLLARYLADAREGLSALSWTARVIPKSAWEKRGAARSSRPISPKPVSGLRDEAFIRNVIETGLRSPPVIAVHRNCIASVIVLRVEPSGVDKATSMIDALNCIINKPR